MALEAIMEDLDKTTAADLKDPAAIDAIETTLQDIEVGQEWGDARKVLNLFKKYPELLDETKTPAEIVQRLWKVWARAAFMGFLSLNKSEIDLLYKEHILEAFAYHRDPRLVLDEQLRSIAYRIDPAPLQSIVEALELNIQRIGPEYIHRQNGKDTPPEVRAWLAEYRQTYDRGVERGAMEEITFMNRNPNVQKLSKEDQRMVRKVIQLLDYLLYPNPIAGSKEFYLKKLVEDALLKEQFEAQQKKAEAAAPAALLKPALEKPVVPVSKPATSMMPPVRPSPFVQSATLLKATEPRHAELSAKGGSASGGDSTAMKIPGQVSRSLSGDPALAVTRNDNREAPPDPIAEIRTMAETRDLLPLLAGKPLTPPNLAAVLKIAYSQRAGLTDELAAREAVHVANILKKQGKPEFLQMAYFDAKEETFKWA